MGGTEVYVKELAGELIKRNVESVVVAPVKGPGGEYVYDGAAVFRYPEIDDNTNGSEPALEAFEKIVRELKADIYHQHSWATYCGKKNIDKAKKIGLKIIVTVHVPGVVCPKGTMMYMDKEQCIGDIRTDRCAFCWSVTKGVPKPVAHFVSRLPLPVCRSLYQSSLQHPIITALSMPAQIEKHKADLMSIVDSSDAVIVVSEWLYDSLRRNHVDSNKLHLIRQGTKTFDHGNKQSMKGCGSSLQIGYLGRWDNIKGIHILLEAVFRIPSDTDLEVRIFNTPKGNDLDQYARDIIRMAERDGRVRLLGKIENERVIEELGKLDFVVVPSQLLETGPLVVYESLAAGTPVIGSNLGGIRELISDGVNGFLIDHNDITAWSECLKELAEDATKRIKINAKDKVRTMSDAAAETLNVYREVAG